MSEDRELILSMIDNLMALDRLNDLSARSVLWLLKTRLNGEETALFLKHAQEVLAEVK